MKINYPIKYAVMPIVEQDGWVTGLNELERNFSVVCYIVTKCYLISDKTKYKEDGEVIKEYEVVYLYQQNQFDKWQKVTPSYNLINGSCTNSNKVDKVFNSYEEALNGAAIKNEKLFERSFMYLPFLKNFEDVIQEKKDEFESKLNKYKALEQQILLCTKDIEIKENSKLNNVIRIDNKKGSILPCGIYSLSHFFSNKKFIVYNISQTQYDCLIKLINEEIEDISSITGEVKNLLLHKTKEDFIKLAINNGCCGAYYIENDSISYSYTLDRVTEEDFKNMDDDTLVFYTTETIDDLLSSFKKYPEIDLNQIQGPVLKKLKE